VPVGFWRFDDCNDQRTELGDASLENHTAFRSVELRCAPGKQGIGAAFASQDDVVFVPDQPAYALDFGLTVAAWVKPDSVEQTQAIFRKSEAHDREHVVRLSAGRGIVRPGLQSAASVQRARAA